MSPPGSILLIVLTTRRPRTKVGLSDLLFSMYIWEKPCATKSNEANKIFGIKKKNNTQFVPIHYQYKYYSKLEVSSVRFNFPITPKTRRLRLFSIIDVYRADVHGSHCAFALWDCHSKALRMPLDLFSFWLWLTFNSRGDQEKFSKVFHLCSQSFFSPRIVLVDCCLQLLFYIFLALIFISVYFRHG